eukprot:6979034-Pyramimonas_sp.AAC.1
MVGQPISSTSLTRRHNKKRPREGSDPNNRAVHVVRLGGWGRGELSQGKVLYYGGERFVRESFIPRG